MELANEDVTMEMEHRTTYLATVGTLGPMIGLVGTVYGMIMAFQVIALEGSSPQASQLAAGISTALYATLEGIAISIPAIFFYAMYRNRIARLSLEVGMAAEPLLEQFAPGVRPAIRRARPANHGPAPAPSAHPHPFALSATLAATGGNARTPGACQRQTSRRATSHEASMPSHRRRTATSSVLNPNLTPLLDVVLQLITFFMMLVHFGTRLEGATKAVRLPVAPAALPGSDLTFDRLGVAMDAQGRLLVEGRALDEEAASAWWADQAKIRRAGLETLGEPAAAQ